jgi:hypothetical protein
VFVTAKDGSIGLGRSVFRFKDDDHTRQFGFMWSETGECRVAPVGKAYNFTALSFPFGRSGGLQDLETSVIEKERMVPKQVVQLGHRGVIIWKNLSIELIQGLF